MCMNCGHSVLSTLCVMILVNEGLWSCYLLHNILFDVYYGIRLYFSGPCSVIQFELLNRVNVYSYFPMENNRITIHQM